METKKLIGGFIVGAALGVAAGLLFAPASGERTRKKLIKGSKRIKDDVLEYIEDSIDTLKTQVNDRIDQVTSKGRELFNHASDKAEKVKA